MSDLRKAIIRLAYDNPELREELSPLLKMAKKSPAQIAAQKNFAEMVKKKNGDKDEKPKDEKDDKKEDKKEDADKKDGDKKAAVETSSELSLRNGIIRLAHAKPELRADLLPLLEEG